MTLRTLVGACVLLLSCAVAQADPIVITGGSISVAPSGGGITFSLSGDGLQLNSAVDSDSRVDLRWFCSPCGANGSLSFDAFLSHNDHGGGPGTVNGIFYPRSGFSAVV